MWRDDLRDSIRSLREDLRGTLLAVSLLAVTIGAITAIYAIVHAVVLRPFTFVDQDRLAMIWQRDDRRALPVIEVAYGNMTDWLARSRSLQSLGLISSVNWSLTLGGGAEPESVPMAGVSASFFPGRRHATRTRTRSPALGRAGHTAGGDGDQPRPLDSPLWRRSFRRRPCRRDDRRRRIARADRDRRRDAGGLRFPPRRGRVGAGGADHPAERRVVRRRRQRAEVPERVLRRRAVEARACRPRTPRGS